MNGVGLQYQGRALTLDEDFSIDWEVEDSLLDFDNVGQGYSWTIYVPIKGNEWAFGYASDPANAKNRFKTYDGFAITMGGNVWWEVSFDLEGVSDDARYYEGVLSTLESTVFANRDKSIREILSTEMWTYPAGGFVDVYDYFNGEVNRGIRFPWVHIYGDSARHPFSGVYTPIMNKDVYAVPFFHLDFVMQKLAIALGYSVEFNVTTNDYKSILIFIPTRFGIYLAGGEFPIGVFLPEMSLYDFIKEVCIYSGSNVRVDLENKKIHFTSFDFIKSKNALDISNETSSVRPFIFDAKDVVFKYATDNDTLLSRDDSDLIGNYRGAFTSLLVPSLNEGDYYFNVDANAYYKAYEFGDEQRIERYCHPFLERKTGVENPFFFESNFSPCITDRLYYSEVNVDASIVSKVYPSFPDDPFAMLVGLEQEKYFDGFDLVGFLELENRESQAAISGRAGMVGRGRHERSVSNSSRSSTTGRSATYRYGFMTTSQYSEGRRKLSSSSYYIGIKSTQLYPISQSQYTLPDPNDNFMVTSMDFLENIKVSKILLAKQVTADIPIVGKDWFIMARGGLTKESNPQNKTASIVMWHGVRKMYDAVTDYPYASSDNMYWYRADEYSDGEYIHLPVMSLNTSESENNIWEAIYAPLFTLISSLRNLKMRAYLSSTKLKKLAQNSRVGKTLTTTFIFKRMKTTLTRKGISNQEIEGYSL